MLEYEAALLAAPNIGRTVQRRAAVAIGDAWLPPASWHSGVAMVASCSLEGLVRLSYRWTAARRGCAFRIEILKMKNEKFWPR